MLSPEQQLKHCLSISTLFPTLISKFSLVLSYLSENIYNQFVFHWVKNPAKLFFVLSQLCNMISNIKFWH